MAHLRALLRLAASDVRKYYPRPASPRIASHLYAYAPLLIVPITPELEIPPSAVQLRRSQGLCSCYTVGLEPT